MMKKVWDGGPLIVNNHFGRLAVVFSLSFPRNGKYSSFVEFLNMELLLCKATHLAASKYLFYSSVLYLLPNIFPLYACSVFHPCWLLLFLFCNSHWNAVDDQAWWHTPLISEFQNSGGRSDLREFQTSLVYKASFMTARAVTEKKCCLKKTNKKVLTRIWKSWNLTDDKNVVAVSPED